MDSDRKREKCDKRRYISSCRFNNFSSFSSSSSSSSFFFLDHNCTYVCVYAGLWCNGFDPRHLSFFLFSLSLSLSFSLIRFDDRTEATGRSFGLKRTTTICPASRRPAVTRRLATAPARSSGRPCCPPETPPGSACRRGSCPFDRRSCPPFSAACSRLPPAAVDPGKTANTTHQE